MYAQSLGSINVVKKIYQEIIRYEKAVRIAIGRSGDRSCLRSSSEYRCYKLLYVECVELDRVFRLSDSGEGVDVLYKL